MPLVKANPDNFLFDTTESTVYYKYGSGPTQVAEFVTDSQDCTLQGMGPQVNMTATTAVTLKATSSGAVVIGTKSSGNQTYTLPVASTFKGCMFTFVCGDAAGEILVNPGNGTDTFTIKASEGGASVVTAAGFGIKNTAATNIKGDRITVVSDGVSSWWATQQSGTWATQ